MVTSILGYKMLVSVLHLHVHKKHNYRESTWVSRKLTDQLTPQTPSNLEISDAAKYQGTVQCIYNSHKDYFVLTDKVSFILLVEAEGPRGLGWVTYR